LQRSVEAIERLPIHPLTPYLAAEKLKKALPDPARIIEATDLITTERAALVRRGRGLSLQGDHATPEGYSQRLAAYDQMSETLTHLMAVLGAWASDRSQVRLVGDTIRQLHTFIPQGLTGSFDDGLEAFQRWPALRVAYASGIAATALRNYTVVVEVWNALEARRYSETLRLTPVRVLRTNAAVAIINTRSEKTQPPGSLPTHLLLHESIAEALRPVCPGDDREQATDLFEYLMMLFEFRAAVATEPRGWRISPSPFQNRIDWGKDNRSGWRRDLESELASIGGSSSLLRPEALGSDVDGALAALAAFDEYLLHGLI
jgi:hypothetical protein